MRTVRASLEDVFLELTQGDALPVPPQEKDNEMAQAEQNEAEKKTDDAESARKEADEA